MWNSTGPVYSAEAFKESHHTFLEVHALCLILAKLAEPSLALAETAQLVLHPIILTSPTGASVRHIV